METLEMVATLLTEVTAVVNQISTGENDMSLFASNFIFLNTDANPVQNQAHQFQFKIEKKFCFYGPKMRNGRGQLRVN